MLAVIFLASLPILAVLRRQGRSSGADQTGGANTGLATPGGVAGAGGAGAGGAGPNNVAKRLQELEDLRAQGAVSEPEYASERRRILDSIQIAGPVEPATPVENRRPGADTEVVRRSPSRIPVRLVCLAAVLGLALPATASAATGDPATNRPLSRTTHYDCSSDPAGSACIAAALADINAAHAAEGVPAMVLPGNFASMSVPVQLLNLANLERVDRGLTPILGLSAALDSDAQAAAARDADPMPTHLYGNTATSNWAGGEGSALEADFEWMYDDGLGSGNLACTSPDGSGCWGHRHDILWQFAAPIAMGAGYATGAYGPSMTELFVGGDTRTGPGQADAPVVRPSQTAGASSGAARPARARVAALAPGRTSVGLTVVCAGPPGSVCKVNVALGRNDVSATVRAGHRRVIHVGLGAAARRLLAARHVLHVRVVVKQRALTLLTRVVTLAAG